MVRKARGAITPSKHEFPHMELMVREAEVVILGGKASEGSTSIHIEGLASSPIFKEPREAFLEVSTGLKINMLGYASGKSRLTVLCDLPRDQFVDLLAMVLAGRLRFVELDFDQLKWNRGILEVIQLRTLAPSAST